MQPPQKFGRFELIKKISSGGMGSVYLARLCGPYSFEKRFIIKLMKEESIENPKDLKRFGREARIAAHFSQRNVVPVFDFGCVGERYYIAMEYIEGFNLTRLINGLLSECRLLPFHLCAFIAAEVARALSYMHSLKARDGSSLSLVHRDVSPENILISRQGEVKLTDFGLVKYRGAETLTKTGKVRGKLAYMPPERVVGKDAVAASDQYSLGMVLHELLVGKRYYSARRVQEKLQQRIVKEAVMPPRKFNKQIPKELDDIVKRATSMEVMERYPSLKEMEHRLRDFATVTCQEDELARLVRALSLKKQAERTAKPMKVSFQELIQGICRRSEIERTSFIKPKKPMIRFKHTWQQWTAQVQKTLRLFL